MSLSKIDVSISVIKFLIKQKRKRIDEIGKKLSPSEQEKIFIGQEIEMIQNVETLIGAFTKELNKNLGRIPPQATELEEAVISACLLEAPALARVKPFLLPEHFYLEANKLVYGAMMALDKAIKPVDMATVVVQLRKSGHLEEVGGALRIAEMGMKVASTANIEYHARILIEMAIKRELLAMSSQLIGDAFDETADCFDLLQTAETKIAGINRWIK